MKNHVKFISYDGKYPNLCRGVLILNIDGKNYSFGYNWNRETDFTSFWYSGVFADLTLITQNHS